MPALAHRLTLRPELWVQRVRGPRTSCAELLDSVPTPPPRTPDPASDPRGRPPEARRLRGARRRSGCSPRSSSAGPSSPRSQRPFALVLVLGARARRASRSSRRRSRSSASALLEGDEVDARGRDSRAKHAVERARAAARRSRPALALVDGRRTRAALRLGAGERRALDRVCGRERWGGVRASATSHVRARDRFGMLRLRASASTRRTPLRVYPRAGGAALACARRRETQVFAGNQRRARARARASSSPTCGRSPSATALRRINWRASARRGELWVNEQHPERNADVVLFLDTLRRGAPRRRRARSTPAVRAAAALAERYLAGATASAWSASAARSAGSCRGRARRSSTASSTRCSTRRSSSATRGRTIDVAPARGRCRRRRS